MGEAAQNRMPRVFLGSQGFEVSQMGFGCYGLTAPSTDPISDEAGIAIIQGAFKRGITFFDTADSYGPYTNEIVIGKALKHLPRERIQLATKFGFMRSGTDNAEVINGKPEFVRASCEASLERLGVDYIDLYIQHRVDDTVPIEETVGEMKKLVQEGKVKYLGLTDASPETIRRAHVVHPITALQMEWSLWNRDIEKEIVPLCRRLGIGIVAYSPLGSGFLAGKGIVDGSSDPLNFHPRLSGNNLEYIMLYTRLAHMAAMKRATPAQLALSWLLRQGTDVVPIPGTTKLHNLDYNIASLNVKLSKADLEEISETLPMSEVAGNRAVGTFEPPVWQLADTLANN